MTNSTSKAAIKRAIKLEDGAILNDSFLSWNGQQAFDLVAQIREIKMQACYKMTQKEIIEAIQG